MARWGAPILEAEANHVKGREVLDEAILGKVVKEGKTLRNINSEYGRGL